MGYSKAYQEVIAGRVRENEQIGFYGNNETAVPGRVFSSNAIGGKTQPTVDLLPLEDEFVGKADNRGSGLIVWFPSSYNN